MSELPQEWAEVPLPSVCDKITDGTHYSPINLPVGEFKYVTAKNIRPWGLDLSDISFVDAETHRDIFARCPVEKGDVLYIKDGATTGLAVVNPLDEPFSMLSSVALIKPNREVLNADYLKYWLNSPSTLSSMLGQMTGTAIRRLTLTTISAQSIPMAPLPEQRRIVAKADSLGRRTARARTDLARVPILLARYKQRLLALAYSGELTAAWRDENGTSAPNLVPISKISEGLRYGTAQKCYSEQNGTAVLRIPNVSSGQVNLRDLKYTKLSDKDFMNLRLENGDILVVRSNGSVDLVGRPAPVSGPAVGLAYAGYLIRIRIDKELLSPAFLTYMLEAPQVRTIIEIGARSTSGVHNVNAKELAALLIPLFDMAEQEEIIRRVEAAFGWIDRIAADHAGAANLLPKLDAAILTKAFRRELVPQDPGEEPIVRLLGRLGTKSGGSVKRGRRARVHSESDSAITARTAHRTSLSTLTDAAPPAQGDNPMSKSRHDPDVLGQPYLAKILRRQSTAGSVEALFKVSDLPVADFYKQLSWEIENRHIVDKQDKLEAV
jgi:type I restriction enzyme S subunit